MKASELRIGNLVKLEGISRPIKVSIIDTTETSTNTKYKPIPLTEEWLVKFNILRENDGLFILSDNLKLSLGADNVKIYFNGIHHLCTIDGFVHVLQNFYHSIYRKELTIKTEQQ